MKYFSIILLILLIIFSNGCRKISDLTPQEIEDYEKRKLDENNKAVENQQSFMETIRERGRWLANTRWMANIIEWGSYNPNKISFGVGASKGNGEFDYEIEYSAALKGRVDRLDFPDSGWSDWVSLESDSETLVRVKEKFSYQSQNFHIKYGAFSDNKIEFSFYNTRMDGSLFNEESGKIINFYYTFLSSNKIAPFIKIGLESGKVDDKYNQTVKVGGYVAGLGLLYKISDHIDLSLSVEQAHKDYYKDLYSYDSPAYSYDCGFQFCPIGSKYEYKNTEKITKTLDETSIGATIALDYRF